MDKQESKTSVDTEQLILQAAAKEFATKGFDGARTSAIAAEAGVTHAMLHYYFRTKEKLFERIFKDKLQFLMNMVLSPIINSGSSIKEKVRSGIEAHFDFLCRNRELPIFFINTINSRPEAYARAVEEMSQEVNCRLADLQRELDKGYANGEIAAIEARALAIDVASLNAFPFLAAPIMMPVMGFQDMDQYLAARRKENVEIIMKRISL